MRIVLVALCAMLLACGGSSGPETAEEAAVRQYEMYAKEQYGRFYDELHPAAQAVTNRDEWIAEESEASLFSIRSVRAVESYDEEWKFPDGTRTVTAVTLEIESGIGALPSDGETQTITIHEELIDGKWRLFQN